MGILAGSGGIPERGKVAIFGGSFDPVHRGHLGMAERVKELPEMEHIVFVPCFVSPFKKSTAATGVARASMLRLACEELGFDWASVSEFEISRQGPSYSWETAVKFSRLRPGVEWHWIVGTDQWEQLEQWAEPEKLRELLKFVVVTRGGADVEPKQGWEHEVINFEHPASSSAIREDFDAHQEWLTPSVLRYCEEAELYAK